MITLIQIGPVHCKKCSKPLGHIVSYKNKAYFFDGLSLVLIGLRRCEACHTLFHWHGDKLKMENVILGYGRQVDAKPQPVI